MILSRITEDGSVAVNERSFLGSRRPGRKERM